MCLVMLLSDPSQLISPLMSFHHVMSAHVNVFYCLKAVRNPPHPPTRNPPLVQKKKNPHVILHCLRQTEVVCTCGCI